MRRIVITLIPWAFDSNRVELRVNVETDGREYEDKRIVAIPEIESAFDFYLRIAGEAIKAAWRANTAQKET